MGVEYGLLVRLSSGKSGEEAYMQGGGAVGGQRLLLIGSQSSSELI